VGGTCPNIKIGGARKPDESPSLAKIEPVGNVELTITRIIAVEAIVAEGLACQRGGRTVVAGISFEVQAGSALALRGANGSGKTTLLRTIAGYLQPAAGKIEVRRPPHPVPLPRGERERLLNEHSLPPLPSRERGGVRGDSEGVYHYIGHANGIKPRLSVIENVSFWQSYYSGAEDIETAEEAEEALEAFGLLNLASFSAGHLRRGRRGGSALRGCLRRGARFGCSTSHKRRSMWRPPGCSNAPLPLTSRRAVSPSFQRISI
jgi:ABC-type transport system involved in cytochrome c biogenesis ATPase subunit